MVFHEHSSFQDIIRNLIEKHFDTIAENPQLMNFVYNEITSNAESRKLVLEVMVPKVKHVLSHLEKLIDDEAAKGLIKPVKISDLDDEYRFNEFNFRNGFTGDERYFVRSNRRIL